MKTKYEIQKFSGSNFSSWKLKIKAIMNRIVWLQLKVDPVGLKMKNERRWMTMQL